MRLLQDCRDDRDFYLDGVDLGVSRLSSRATWWYVVFVSATRYRGGEPDDPSFNPIGILGPISRRTLPAQLAQEVGLLLEKHRRFLTVLDPVRLECFVGEVRDGPGKTAGHWLVQAVWGPPSDRQAQDRSGAATAVRLVALSGDPERGVGLPMIDCPSLAPEVRNIAGNDKPVLAAILSA